MANVDTFAHTAVDALSADLREEQVRRILQSATFRNAATLQVFFSSWPPRLSPDPRRA